MNTTTTSVLETNQRLSQSHLWHIQRQFFNHQGIQAWNTGKVPHYVTSNPYIARAYGNVVMGFLRDCMAGQQSSLISDTVSSLSLDTSHPLYIVELGAGSGRFAYHFLKTFFTETPQPVLQQLPVKYIMTDFAQSTLEFWQSHPSLKPYIGQGILDFAQFDVQTDSSLQLVHSGETLSPGTLQNPLIVFANYFFDSIPQDLFTIQAGQLHESLVTLTFSNDTVDLTQPDSLETLDINFTDRPITSDYYSDPNLNQVLQYYQQQLDDTSLLLPVIALEGLARLRQLAGDHLLLLTADKGYSQEVDLQNRPKPKLVFHQGCFSLSVNYHAIAQYTTMQGGKALLPHHPSRSIQVCVFAFGAEHHPETQHTYHQSIQTAGPDDFFSLKKTIEPHYDQLTLPQLLAYLRFSGWDSNIFLGCFPALLAQVKSAPPTLHQSIVEAAHHIWQTYYWIGEDTDFALRLSILLAEIENYNLALEFTDYSIQRYGEKPNALLHQVICHFRLGQTNTATTQLEQLLALDPQNTAAHQLRQAMAIGPSAIESLLDRPLFSRSGLHPTGDATQVDPLSFAFLNLRAALERYIEQEPLLSPEQFLQVEPSALTQLGEKFQLSLFERLILLLGLGLELEPNFRALCANAQGDSRRPYATLGLALSALPKANWSVLSPQNPLHYWQLIHTESGRLLTDSPITLDRRILCYLLGQPALEPYLSERCTPLSSESSTRLPSSYQTIAQQLVATWSEATSQPLPPVVLCGGDGNSNRTIALNACEQLGFQIMALSTDLLPNDPHDLKQFQRHWEREAILSNSVLLLESSTALPETPNNQTAISLFIETLTTPIIFSGHAPLSYLHRPIVTIDVPSLPHAEQTLLWQTHLGDTAHELNGHLDVLANQFKLTPSAIQTVCHQFQIQTAKKSQHSEKTNPPEIKSSKSVVQDSLWALCRQQTRPMLDDLAQRIEATATWQDLVLPSRQYQILEDIAAHLKYRAQIYQTWGFSQKGQRGLGISALFYGDSGTGKTMAAEVIAQACRLDLYRIDLSTVVSKYIGETEKNLRRIFDAAEAGGVILLFDEADALFGKRTEVKDSHDRNANIEVSYLLQRLETYQGLAILTSNFKTNLDQAFLRRLRFMVSFPLPDADARMDIWQRVFPQQTPTHNLDYEKLSQLKVTGGNIRNIALNAAFLAAQADQPVGMEHIQQAAQQEYLKLEKLLTKEELRGWSNDDLSE